MEPMNTGLRTVYRTGPRANGSGSVHYFLADVDFGTSRVGWCVGSQNVLLTTDKGLTWRNFFVDGATLPFAEPRRVAASGENGCWLLGLFHSGLCRTIDQGQSWHYVDFSGRVALADFDVCGGQIAVIGTRHRASRDQVAVFVGSETIYGWREITLPITGEPRKIRLAADSSLVILSESLDSAGNISSLIHRTQDFGNSWKRAFSMDGELAGVEVLQGKGLLLFGESGIVKSTNDDTKIVHVWRSRENEFVNAVQIRPSGVGIGVTSQGGILLTRDDGDSWLRLGNCHDEDLIAVQFLTETSALVLGEETINVLTFH